MKNFLKGTVSALLSGAVTGVAGQAINWANGTLAGGQPALSGSQVGLLALAGAVVGLSNYLAPSPLPPPKPKARKK